MKLRFPVLSFLLVLTSIAAHAQTAGEPVRNEVGLYVNPAFTRISNSDTDTGPFAFMGDNTTSRTFYGANIGGYYDFYHAKSFEAGVEIRDSIVKGNNASLNSFLVGGRLAAKPIAYVLKPYVQLMGGVGSSKPPHSSVHVSRAGYDVFAGLDYQFSNHVDFRVVEVGYGSVSTVNSGNFGGPVVLPASHLLNISTGLVFHFGVK